MRNIDKKIEGAYEKGCRDARAGGNGVHQGYEDYRVGFAYIDGYETTMGELGNPTPKQCGECDGWPQDETCADKNRLYCPMKLSCTR